MTKSKLGSQTQMKARARAHTHMHAHTRARKLSPALPRRFPTQSQGSRKGSWSWEWKRGPSPSGSSTLLHLLPAVQSPAPPPPGLLLPQEEITEQCGRSENGHPAKGPGLGLGRPWALPPGGPTPASQAPVSVGFPVAWPSSDLLPTFSPSL